MAEVGEPDPIAGGTVLAILDLGRHHPYAVQCEGGDGPAPPPILVDKPIYEVTEFGRGDGR